MKTAEPMRLEQWQHPVTGERVSLSYREGVTRLERGGKVSELGPPPFDEAAALREAQEQVGRWDVFSLRHLREMAEAGVFKENGRTLGVEDLGFPPGLWEELDAFEAKMAPGSSSSSPPGAGGVPAEYHSATVIGIGDPARGGLLWNPTPEMRRRFAELMAERVRVAPPPADTPFHEQGQRLAREGFVRMSARNEGGSLWLPPGLETHRRELERWERPVVRPFVVPGIPAPWESKLGGVPYRPQGTPWPTQASGSPLHFLAQIDLGVANARGQVPELPRRGLLQFFLAHSDAPYEEVVRHPERGDPAVRGLYWPEVVRDGAALTREVPTAADEDWADSFNPPERALAFLDDREFPSLLDDRVASLKSAVPDLDSLDLHPNGHRLGGHAMLINAAFPPEQDWRLLFQFDGDDVGGQVYGSGGGLGGWLGFFVRAEDLSRLDFSRVRLELDAF